MKELEELNKLCYITETIINKLVINNYAKTIDNMHDQSLRPNKMDIYTPESLKN
jgi:DNA polymerase III alpha subunit (gram-positive type)